MEIFKAKTDSAAVEASHSIIRRKVFTWCRANHAIICTVNGLRVRALLTEGGYQLRIAREGPTPSKLLDRLLHDVGLPVLEDIKAVALECHESGDPAYFWSMNVTIPKAMVKKCEDISL